MNNDSLNYLIDNFKKAYKENWKEAFDFVLEFLSFDEIKYIVEKEWRNMRLLNYRANEKYVNKLISDVKNLSRDLNNEEKTDLFSYLFKSFKKADPEKIEFLMNLNREWFKRVIEMAEEWETIKTIYYPLINEQYTSTLTDKEKKLRSIIANYETISEENKNFLISDIVDLDEFKKVHEDIWSTRYSVRAYQNKIIDDVINWRIENITDKHKELVFRIWYSQSMWGYLNNFEYLMNLDFNKFCKITKETNFELNINDVIWLMNEDNYENEKNKCLSVDQKRNFIEKYHSHYFRENRNENIMNHILENETIDNCLFILWLAENYKNYEKSYFEKKYKEFINKWKHTIDEKEIFLTDLFFNSYFRLPQELKDELLKFEVKDFYEFHNWYEWYYKLRAFLLKYKYKKNILKDWFIQLKCWHKSDDIQKYLFFADFYEWDEKSFNEVCSICNPSKSWKSMLEEKFYKDILSIYKWDWEIIKNDRKELWWKEIDVLILEKDWTKKWFELHWLYWHRWKVWLERSQEKLELSKKCWVDLFIINEYQYNFFREEFLEEIDFLLNWKTTMNFEKRKLDYIENNWIIEIKNFIYSEYIIDELKEIIKNNKWKKILVKHEKELWNWKIYEDLWFKNIWYEDPSILELSRISTEFYRLWYDIYEYDHK